MNKLNLSLLILTTALLAMPTKGKATTMQANNHQTANGTERNADNFYPINFAKTMSNVHNTRRLNGILLNGQSVATTDPTKVYHDLTAKAFSIDRKMTLSPSLDYEGIWMNSLVYMDKNRNGGFEWNIPGARGAMEEGNEIVSFSALTCADEQYYNSKGESLADLNNLELPHFNLAADLPVGYYMLRYKVDWDSADPAGKISLDNHIARNGGGIVDVRLFVHDGGEATLHTEGENGQLTTLTDTPVDGMRQPYGTAMLLKVVPDEGYKIDRIVLRHGLLNAPDSLVNGVAQYADRVFLANEIQNGILDIESGLVDGDLRLTAFFIPKTADDADDEPYVLVFNDEFNQADGSRPDPTRWKSSPREGATWSRFIADKPELAYIENNSLVLKCIPNPDRSTDDVEMISGAIETRDLFSFTYGRVDVRMKTKRHVGNFPAAWMMPQPPTEPWPMAGEIDIFEAIDDKNTAYHTVHSNWTYNKKMLLLPKSYFSETMTVENWHVYSVIWTENLITWLVDGKKMGSYAKASSKIALNGGQWPFTHAFFLILNQSVGNGSWAKKADVNFHYESHVDYIRVFQPASRINNSLQATSGIREVNAPTPHRKGIYNLQGCRVSQPGKGIYIKDGKKMAY
ncbi:MAG: glycoside hydrolase family 16 protein [Prevotella sp.]|nr:glycoside hydrolase family 16 protein [Prevotellaceae bacterium]MDY3365310.1 glycoside hydrolase family 16 protein [Prevotella sp.]MDY3852943.1 glycoside hydrolase family 16 protein [Prevotella sp.]